MVTIDIELVLHLSIPHFELNGVLIALIVLEGRIGDLTRAASASLRNLSTGGTSSAASTSVALA